MSGSPAATYLQSEHDCADFVRGCTLLATGGGGPPEREQAATGKPAGWVAPRSLPDDLYTVSAFGMGGRPPAGHPTADELAAAGLDRPRQAHPAAIRAPADYAGVRGAVAPGQRVAVVGIPAVAAFRSPAGLDRLGPRHFGFDIDYVPLEERVR